MTSQLPSGLPSLTSMISYFFTNVGSALLKRATKGSTSVSPRYTGTTTDRFIGRYFTLPASKLKPVPVCQNGQSARHFSLLPLRIPVKHIAKDARQLFDRFAGDPSQHCQER